MRQYLPLVLKYQVMSRKSNPYLRGLIAYYPLDEYSGTRNDTNNRFGITSRVVTTYAPGKLGNAVNLTGATNMFYEASAQYGAILGGGFTVTGWVNLNADARVYVASSTTTYNEFYLCYYGSNSWRFYVADATSGDSVAIVANAAQTGVWVFLAGRYNPDTRKAELNVNALDKGVGNAISNGPKQDYRKFAIGKNSGSNALIDSVGFWNRYLSDAEIAALYNNGDGFEYPFTPYAVTEEATEAYHGPTWYVAA